VRGQHIVLQLGTGEGIEDTSSVRRMDGDGFKLMTMRARTSAPAV
jgi:hypothetical protein